MSSEKSLTPQIRFKGFTEAWEQRKLGDLSKILGGFAWSSKEYTPRGEFLVITISNVTGDYFIDDSIGNRINLEKESNYILASGDILVSLTGNVGRVSKMGPSKGVLNQRVAKMIPSKKIEIEFLFQLMRDTKFELKMIESGQGAAQKNISNNNILSYSTNIPNISEQKRIGHTLKKIDSLITLHQRKLDALKKIKSALLEKMFPKDGSNIPEIRFAGYTEAWEQCKLGNLAIFNPNADLPAQFEYVDLESVAGTEMLSHRTELRDSAPSRAQRLAQFGDLFYQTVRPYQKNNYLYEKPDNNYVFSTGYAQMRPLVDGYFLLSLVQNEGFIKKVLDNCSGTSYPAINANVLSSIVVNSSSHRKEQIQIGCLFRRIDNLITLHQRKLDALKKIKSALLEKMFV